MNLDKIIRTGNEVRIKSEKGSFITSIDEVIDEETLTILGPLEPEQRLIMKPGETFLISCVTERGLYMFETLVKDMYNVQNVCMAELKVISDYKKIQRREAFRARESIEVSVRKRLPEDEKTGKWVNTHTVDISETGLLLKYNEECMPGQLLDLVIRIDSYGIKEIIPKVTGRVARCTATGNKQYGYFLGLQFENLPERARNAIIKLVVLSQRSKLTYKHIKRY